VKKLNSPFKSQERGTHLQEVVFRNRQTHPQPHGGKRTFFFWGDDEMLEIVEKSGRVNERKNFWSETRWKNEQLVDWNECSSDARVYN
jgi:hypothetical protein